ncbi:hypothetical protein NQ318_015512 [Aromia moschata]|uniref:Gustatory receptor n=1 Tax=Aromia moschata TaxID=1265417 RepID=A0AAV8XS19_9CUCU|nr:hypothetical protein NQ318_015512 [Aromia moschata]
MKLLNLFHLAVPHFMSFITHLPVLAPISNPPIHKFYAIILQLAIIVGFCYSVYGKQTPLFDTYSYIVKLVDQIATFVLTLTNISTITLTVFCYPKKFGKILRDLSHFDSRVSCVFKRKMCLFVFTVIAFHVMVAITIIMDWYAWSSGVGFNMYKFYVARDFQIYHVSVTMLLVFWMAVEIGCRFSALNDLLTKVSANFCYVKLDGPSKEFAHRAQLKLNYRGIKSIAKLHNFLCDILNDFNRIFGLILLFAVVFFITFIVLYTIALITYTIMDDSINGVTFGVTLLLACVFWVLHSMIRAHIDEHIPEVTLLALAAAGDHLAVTANKTSIICYSILNDVDESSRQDLLLLKAELKLLANQITCRSPRLTASGFFVINLTMMGFIIRFSNIKRFGTHASFTVNVPTSLAQSTAWGAEKSNFAVHTRRLEGGKILQRPLPAQQGFPAQHPHQDEPTEHNQRDIQYLTHKLTSMRPNKNEKPYEFGLRVQEIRAVIITKINDNIPVNQMRDLQIHNYTNIAKTMFIMNLPMHIQAIVRIQNTESLEDALNFVLEVEEFQNFVKLHQNTQKSNLALPKPSIPLYRNQSENFNSNQKRNFIQNSNSNFIPPQTAHYQNESQFPSQPINIQPQQIKQHFPTKTQTFGPSKQNVWKSN